MADKNQRDEDAIDVSGLVNGPAAGGASTSGGGTVGTGVGDGGLGGSVGASVGPSGMTGTQTTGAARGGTVGTLGDLRNAGDRDMGELGASDMGGDHLNGPGAGQGLNIGAARPTTGGTPGSGSP